MLTELEKRLMARGVHRRSALAAEGETGVTAFRNCGYETRDLTYFERVVPLQPQDVGLLDELGGRMLPRGLWHMLAGMEHEKDLIERRVVLPSSSPSPPRGRVKPPRAMALFGPPGTGKTTFAKAVAARLGWPFVELFPSRLAAANEGRPGPPRARSRRSRNSSRCSCSSTKSRRSSGMRGGKPPSPLQGVTNELLEDHPRISGASRGDCSSARRTSSARSIPRSCATGGLITSSLSALLTLLRERPSGDATSRPASLSESTSTGLVEASDLFTPADIEFAARKGSAARGAEIAVYGDLEQQPQVGRTNDRRLCGCPVGNTPHFDEHDRR